MWLGRGEDQTHRIAGNTVAAYTFLVSINGARSVPIDLDFSDHEDVVASARMHLQVVLASKQNASRACVCVNAQQGDRLSRLGLWNWSTETGWEWQAG